jgi:hypothetical protein
MMMSRRKGRSVLWLAAALLFITGVVIGAGVIPIAGIYSSPYIGPGAVMSVCWSYIFFSGIAAIILGFIAASVKNLSLSAGTLLAIVMLVAVLFSFGLSEAAFGFHSRGPALQVVAVLLHLCSAADFAVALLVLLSVVLLPKSIHRTRGAFAN